MAATPPPTRGPLHTRCTACHQPIASWHCTSHNCPWCRKCNASKLPDVGKNGQ